MSFTPKRVYDRQRLQLDDSEVRQAQLLANISTTCLNRGSLRRLSLGDVQLAIASLQCLKKHSGIEETIY